MIMTINRPSSPGRSEFPDVHADLEELGITENIVQGITFDPKLNLRTIIQH